MKKKKHRRRLKPWVKKTLFFICIAIFSFGFIYSFINIIIYIFDEKDTKELIKVIDDNAVIIEDENEDEVEIIDNNQDEIVNIDDYYKYIRMRLIDVDFNELLMINNSVKGWIQVNGTNVNYPFVQADDNSFYLSHSFDKSYNVGGWVFLDYRINMENTDNKNTILYAHGMDNNTMFGSLKNILYNDWLDNSDNFVIKMSTMYENTLWQVFSVYRIPTTSDYLQVDFISDEDFLDFGNKLIKRSDYNFNTGINENDRILTLSTCYNNYDKIVIHAKLIKRTKKEY